MKRLLVAGGLVVVVLSNGAPVAWAATTLPPPIEVDPQPGAGGGVGIGVQEPGSPGSGGVGAGQPGGGLGEVGGGNSGSRTCTWTLDAIDNTELLDGDLSRGAFYTELCSDGFTQSVFVPAGTIPGAANPGTPVTPAVLAQRAYGLLKLPAPVIRRSPGANNSDNGAPYTWVNLWTWFWTDQATYRPLSKTVTAGGVSATVVATPTALVFDPGDGDAPVWCAGPGRAWRHGDGDSAPAAGGCGYVYRHVSDGLTSTVSITWSVTWRGNNNTSGTLPVLTTTATSRFQVEQIEAVNR